MTIVLTTQDPPDPTAVDWPDSAPVTAQYDGDDEPFILTGSFGPNIAAVGNAGFGFAQIVLDGVVQAGWTAGTTVTPAANGAGADRRLLLNVVPDAGWAAELASFFFPVTIGTFSRAGPDPSTPTEAGPDGPRWRFSSIVPDADPVDITTTALDDAEDGVAYSDTVVAIDGTTPYSWAVTSGSLPPGLSLNASTGAITGTPTTPGSYTFDVTVTDDASETDTVELTIEVYAAVDITDGYAAGEVGVAYSELPTATGGLGPFVWSSPGPLPLGLTLDPATGELSGTPLEAGDHEFDLTITDSLGGTETEGITLTIVALAVAPRVLRAEGLGLDRVRIFFDRPMSPDAVLRATSSYTLLPADRAVVGVSPSAAAGPTAVTLRFARGLTAGDTYQIAVDLDAESAAGIPIDPFARTATWTPAAAAPYQERGQRLVVGVEIESIGTVNPDGAVRPWRLFNTRPRRYTDYADGMYLPILGQWPSAIEQEQHPLGGVATSGELTVVLVDVRDQVTQLLAIHRLPVNYLAAPLTRTDTEATFATNTGLAEDLLIYAGGEVMQLDSLDSGTTWVITRAELDTGAQRHSDEAPVLLGTPILMGRRIRLFVGYNDGRHSSADEDEIEAGWAIDQAELTPDLGAWVLRGRSQLKYLDRLLDRRPFQATLTAFAEDQTRVTLQPVRSDPVDYLAYRRHFDDRVFFRFGKNEIRQLTPAGLVEGQPVAGTLEEKWREGDAVRQVFVARANQTGVDYGSFRYQLPGAETSSRSTGTWFADAHAICIILNLITGKSDIDDNTPDNYTSGSGNFSALPPGVGLGTPAAEIDFGSALDIWHRAPHLVLEHFVLDATETGRDALDRILKLTGIDIGTANGLLTFSYVRTPLADDVVAEWGPAELVGRNDGNGNIVPAITAKLDASLAIGAVEFKARNARGDAVQLVYSDADFPEVFGDVRGLYSIDEKPLPIDASAVRCEDAGGEPELLRQRALQILRNYRRAPWRYGLVTPRDQRGIHAGQFIRLTYPQLPDLVAGQRGVVRQTVKLLSKRETVSAQAVEIAWDGISFPAARAGRISPAARISGAATGNVVPVSANRYTDPAARGGLPNNDAAGFRVGDRVCLKTRGCLRIATTPAYQEVVAVGPGNQLELDGDFGGDAAFDTAGTIIAFVAHADATPDQRARFVFMSDRATRTVGSSSETPWTWGEG